jgi:hypothetical protein
MKISLPFLIEKHGMLVTVSFSFVLTMLFMGMIYTHMKCWLTEPGYPEKISTAQTKIAFSKARMLKMSENMK